LPVAGTRTTVQYYNTYGAAANCSVESVLLAQIKIKKKYKQTLFKKMENRYWTSFWIASVVCAGLQVYSRNQTAKINSNGNGVVGSTNARFASFQKNYLIVFLLAMFSDWLQAPMYMNCTFLMGSVKSK